MKRRGIAFAAVLASLSACSGGQKSSAPDAGPAISALQAVEWPGNVLAYDVRWTTARAADTELAIACDGLEPWTLSDATATLQHHAFVMGLVAGASCSLTATASSADGAQASDQTHIDVGALPSYLPALELTVPATESLAPGWTLINLSDQQLVVPYIVALVDPEGRYRWYYQYPTAMSGSDTPVSQYADGVLIGGHEVPLSYVTWQGDLVWSGPTGHHEARPAETSGDFYTLGFYRCPTFTNEGEGGLVVEYEPATKMNVWTWALCDHYTPPQDVLAWAHLNTVALFPDQKSLLISSRDQNSIMKVDRASGDLVWVMGYHGEVEDGFHGDFTMAASDRFLHQHDTTVLPSGNILMFDNGRAGAREYSRALEIAYTYNPAGGSEAHEVWEYRHDPDIFAPVWGGVERFDNGDTLVCFGQQDPALRSTIVEVSADSRVLWEIQTPSHWGVYRARRIAAQVGAVLPASP